MYFTSHLNINKQAVKFNKDGSFDIQYFACDFTGNREKPYNLSFKVDVTSPESISSIADTRPILNPRSLIEIKAKDSSIGVDGIYFKLNDEPFKEYLSEISPEKLAAGPQKLTYYAIDKLKNKEKTKEDTFFFDPFPPKLSLKPTQKNHQEGDILYLSPKGKIKIIATDEETRWRNHYQYFIRSGDRRP